MHCMPCAHGAVPLAAVACGPVDEVATVAGRPCVGLRPWPGADLGTYGRMPLLCAKAGDRQPFGESFLKLGTHWTYSRRVSGGCPQTLRGQAMCSAPHTLGVAVRSKPPTHLGSRAQQATMCTEPVTSWSLGVVPLDEPPSNVLFGTGPLEAAAVTLVLVCWASSFAASNEGFGCCPL
jgi:hypothetical protein